ncbi:hypothetical protein EW145_g5179 [Phellinidium pouzarii]|uniref:PUM-HD domain-containing protein n=1 Tax=Phellinidium pouzarii TaxID=167371 RepID=A0A4S4L2A0_9AGAM|nr:hypothetical protein EW145_g5179 [Phellinidium pouzarii]
MPLASPLNLKTWLADNTDRLQPPVNNFCLYSGKDFVVMAVGGPNERSDYHFNETEVHPKSVLEWFYQHKGAMLLRIVEAEEFRDVRIGEGEMFLLPANTPHNPVRFADTVGLVIERVRPDDAIVYSSKNSVAATSMAATKISKKRAAPLAPQNGPALKKVHLDSKAVAAPDKHKPASKHTKKQTLTHAQKEDNKKKLRRKMPVTSDNMVSDDSEEGDGDEWEDIDGGDEEEEEGIEAADDVEPDDGNALRKDTKNASAQSTREAHKARKILHNERRAAKQHADVLAAAKVLWTAARRKESPREQRSRDIAALMEAVRGRVQDLVLKHDASRIVQTLVKHSTQAERDEVAAELKGRYKELAQNKYSKFLVTKLIRNCPSHRASILLEFRGHVVRLLLHREASSVIADAFELYANAYERAMLLHDFYGKEVSLFSTVLGRAAAADEQERVELKKGLAGILEGSDNEKRKRVLAAIKSNLELILNNPEKGAISHAIFHHVMWEYLVQVNELDDEALREKLRRELFEACQEVLAEMVHTRNGSRIVREFIAEGTAKDRKQVVKVLKPHVERICKDDEAQLVLFTALDVIDDTKMTAKSLVAEITARAASLYSSPQGRRALLYLLVPRSPRHFTPAQSVLLAETDVARARTSKKDASLRQEEVRKAASPTLVALLEDASQTEVLIRDPGGSLLVVEIMLCAESDKTKATDSLLRLLQQPYPSPADASSHIIDVPHACRVYKTLLQGGHYSQQTRAVVRAPSSAFSPMQFASTWLKVVGRVNTREMGKGGGAFVLAALVECVQKEGTGEEKAELREWFDETYRKEIEEGEAKGKKVLLNTLGG